MLEKAVDHHLCLRLLRDPMTQSWKASFVLRCLEVISVFRKELWREELEQRK